MKETITFVGLDVHKESVSVAVADGGLRGEARTIGAIANRPAAALLLRGRPVRLRGPSDADGLGHDCAVVAPSLIPRRPGDRVKTDRRDCLGLAKLERAGELTALWVPDAEHEAMRGVALVTAATLVAEVGDLRRFEGPRQLMAHLGLVPGEHSSAGKVRRGGLTKAGNSEARRVMIEAAWCYRLPARVSRCLLDRLAGLPKEARDIAWKAQLRLCARYRRRRAQGKDAALVTAAIAREMLGFIWAIAQVVAPAKTA